MITKSDLQKIIVIVGMWFFSLGFIFGVIVGEYLEMKFLTEQTFKASQNNNILKNDYGYFKVEKIDYPVVYSNFSLIQNFSDNLTIMR